MTIQQGSGLYPLATITSTELAFHPTTYRSDMPIKQSILLDGYTVDELISAIEAMGYTATIDVTAEAKGFGSRKASILMGVINMPIVAGATLTGFTSNLWQLLYPISRLLEALDADTDNAIQQMYATATSGKWADYWATYFNLRRLPGESDLALRKRVFVAIMNMKTNNIALKEIIQYVIGGYADVTDVTPAQFRVDIDAKFINTVANVHQAIRDNKGGGIDYFINYLSTLLEDYKSYYKDLHGVNFNNSDVFGSGGSDQMSVGEPSFMLDPTLTALFRTGSTPIGTGYSLLQRRTLDGTYYGSWERWLTEATYTKPTEAQGARSLGLTEALFKKTIEAIERIIPIDEANYSARTPVKPMTFKLGSSHIGDSTQKLSRQELFIQESISVTLTYPVYEYRQVTYYETDVVYDQYGNPQYIGIPHIVTEPVLVGWSDVTREIQS